MSRSLINAIPRMQADPSEWSVADDTLRFPLAQDYPVVSLLQEDGSYKVISRNGDDIWDFTELEGAIRRIYIRNSKWSKKNRLTDENIELLRDMLGYFWLSDRQQITFSTLYNISKNLRSFLAECSRLGIVATDLFKKPNAASQIFQGLTIKCAHTVIRLLAEIYACREIFGFFILTPQTLNHISKLIPKDDVEQTPYIPVRIWNYQALRLTEFLKEFMDSFAKFESLNTHLVSIYKSCGYADARKSERGNNVSPFNQSNKGLYAGSFSDLAREYEVDEIIEKWMVSPSRSFDVICNQSGPRILSSYLTAVTFVGLLYLANFSGMRSDELLSLTKNSVVIEEDKDFGNIYFLQAGTTKTVVDKDALWVTSPFSEKVVDALAKISLMRIACAVEFARGIVGDDDHTNPYLFMRAYEPWGLVRGQALDSPVSIKKVIRYGQWRNYAPNLFDDQTLTITDADFLEAKKYTPTLNAVKFAVGKQWSLAMHQLRRTLIVNAVEGGVSIFSTQYQAKHQSLIMTKLYASKHVGKRLSKQMKLEFMDVVYSSIVSQALELKDDKYVSVYGAEHKALLIEFVDVTHATKLVEGAVSGSYSIRETFYGLCFKKGYCPAGGISFVAACPSCHEGLGDKTKLPALKAVQAQVATQSVNSVPGSKLAESLNRQLDIVSSAIVFLEQ
jgi:hypothetical protein